MSQSSSQSRPTRPQLVALLEASKLLNSTLDSEKLLHHIIEAARELSSADRATLYLADHESGELWTHVVSGPEIKAFRMPLGQGIAGRAVETGRASRIRDAYRSKHFNRTMDAQTGYRTKTVLTVPFRGRDRRVMGAIQAINRVRKGEFSPTDQTVLQHLGDYAALALENARYVEALKEKRRMEEDLIAARTIQINLLPQSLPTDPRVDVAARYVPCLEVGGDTYDALRLDDDRFGLSLGDVAGKGITAALMMANLQAIFRAESRRGDEPSAVVRALNDRFHETTESHHFATFFYAILDLTGGQLQYCSAGHEPMVLVRADGSLAEIPRGGMLLGVLPGFKFFDSETVMGPGDVGVVYSDGITEQSNPKDDMFGRDRLVDVLRENRDRPASEIIEVIEEAVDDFAGETKRADDFTMLVFRRVA